MGNKRMQLFRMKCFGIWNTQHAPSEMLQSFIAFRVFHNKFRMPVNTAINLDYQPRRCNREIRNVPSNRMLSSHRKAKFPKMPKCLPSGLFCRCCRFSEFSCSFGWVIHPLTLNPSPQWGEGLFTSPSVILQGAEIHRTETCKV